MLPYLLALIIEEQAATVPPPLPASVLAQPHFSLKPPPADCGKSTDPDEIVVCASDAEKKYRIQPVDPTLYVDPAIRAETQVGGGTLGVTASRVMVGGVPSNRVMLNFKIKF